MSSEPTRVDFTSTEGVTIAAYRWDPEGPPRAIAQITHGVGEYATRYARVADALTAAGYVVYAHDHRGHANSVAGEADYGVLGENGWTELVADIGRMGARAKEAHPGLPLGLVAHSLGSFATQQLLLDHSEEVDAVALSGTAAIDWMRKSVAIDQNPDHMAVLAVALLSTGGMPEALQWAQKAADKGSSKGMEVLAMARLSGEMGVPKDIALAEKLLNAAAQKGDVDAELSLGQFYITGLFGRQDVAAGVRWLQTAADAGSAKAAGTLAYFLITGKQGVPVDAPRGVALARKAMAANEMLGHYAMGVAYVSGAGVAENPAEGWYQISLAQRMDNQQQLKSAADYLAKASAKLTPTQLAQLKARVDADAGAATAASGS